MRLYDYRTQLMIAVVLMVLFVFIGAMYGANVPASDGTFGDVLAAFANRAHTRLIILLILIDWLAGIIAAIRYKIFVAHNVASFVRSTLLPYLFGWLLASFLIFGLAGILGSAFASVLALLIFAAISTSLVASIIDNIQQAATGVTAPNDGPARG